MGKYFGTDGIRDKAKSLMAGDFLYRVGRAIAVATKVKKIVIGADTRESSAKIITEITEGISNQNVEVYLAKNITTSMLAYYTKLKQMVGIMITASHNPYDDNGIKVINCGYKLDENLEKEIERLIDYPLDDGLKKGHTYIYDDVFDSYLDYIFKLNFTFADINIGYDCANGASFKVAPYVFDKYFKRAKGYNIKPNGTNINENCGSTNLGFIQEKVIKNKHDIGFAFDGDGDRCLIVDKKGNTIDGDLMLYIFATYLKKQGLLQKNHVVLTKMSNPGILKALKDENISYSLTDVGDKYVYQEMSKNNYNLGGEASGHIIVEPYFHTGDGIFLALFMLNILSKMKTSIDELVKHISFYPFKMINIRDVNKNVLDDKQVQKAINQAKQVFKDDYLVLVRPSGTEPLVRVTMSYKDENILNQQIENVVNIIKEKGAV